MRFPASATPRFPVLKCLLARPSFLSWTLEGHLLVKVLFFGVSVILLCFSSNPTDFRQGFARKQQDPAEFKIRAFGVLPNRMQRDLEGFAEPSLGAERGETSGESHKTESGPFPRAGGQ